MADLDDEVDALYGLPLDAFVPERDALAKRLRADKRREEADAVKALRKPSVAAWAANQVLRSQPGQRDALLEAGAKVCTLPIQASRVRITGAFAEESFSPKRGMGKRENRYFHFFATLRTWWDRRR